MLAPHLRRSHNWRGNSLSVVASALMKCALKVWMAHSVALTWWLLGSMSKFSQRCRVRYYFITLLAWLSITLSFILCPFDCRSLNCCLYAAKIHSSVKFFYRQCQNGIGLVMIYNQKTYIPFQWHERERSGDVAIKDASMFICKRRKTEYVGRGLFVGLNDIGRLEIWLIGGMTHVGTLQAWCMSCWYDIWDDRGSSTTPAPYTVVWPLHVAFCRCGTRV